MEKIIVFLFVLFLVSCDNSTEPVNSNNVKVQSPVDAPTASSTVTSPARYLGPKDIKYSGTDKTLIKSQIDNSEYLKGINCDGFYKDNLAEQIDEFISRLFSSRDMPSYEEYSIEKRFIEGSKLEVIDTSSYDDAVFIYFGPKKNSIKQEAILIGKNTTTTTDYFSIKKEDNRLEVSKPLSLSFYPENLPDSRILVLKNDKCYVIGLHGMDKHELRDISNAEWLDKKTTWILTTSRSQGGLKEVAELDNSLKSKKIKVKAVYAYLIDNILYKEGIYCRSIYGALVQKRAVCAGYAVAFNYLLSKLGFSTNEYKYIVGGNHAWNHVKLGDDWYHVDSTWGDIPKNYYIKSGIKDSRYNHFLKSDGVAREKKHTVSTDYCIQTKYDSVDSQNKLEWGNWTDDY